MAEVDRHLERELPAGPERAGQTREQPRMIRRPVERGIGEDEVEGRIRRERRQVAPLESQAAALERLRLLEHRRRGVEAQRLRGAGAAVQLARQLARPAAEIDGAAAGNRRDEREQVEERAAAFRGEARVDLGVPGVGAQ